MHPDRRFAVTDEAALRATVLDIAVVHLFAAAPAGPMVAHVPLTAGDGGNFEFHISRGNRLTPFLDGASVVASAMGVNGYVSPTWYADATNQVPTWNYTAVEIDGTCRRLDAAALRRQIDALSAVHEARIEADPPWTMAKVEAATETALMRGIVGFELIVTALRGTHKMSQNKSEATRTGVMQGARAAGNTALAAAMSRP